MARPLRIAYENAWYHVMNRGKQRQKIFHCDEDYRHFLDIVKETSRYVMVYLARKHAGLKLEEIAHLYEQQDRSEMEVLFTLLADLYERSSVKIDSNLPFSKWEQIFKVPMVIAAAIDRLVPVSSRMHRNIFWVCRSIPQ